MGCFMGCFGLSSNKKRRSSIRKILPRDQRICSYEPLLHSSDPTDFNTFVDNPQKISNSNLRCEVEEDEEEKKKVAKKTRKRVRFDLNVQTYEPIVSPTFENDCSDNEEGSSVIDKKPEDLSSRPVYPSNYRYHNCVTSFVDEDDEMGYGESDLEDEDYYTDDENDYEDDADDEEEEKDQDQDVTPLLNPVENLAQWKAVKARPVKLKREMKENVQADMDDHHQATPLLKELIVNTSLSNWIASPKRLHGNGSSKRSPIVDITNMENR
ncbi:PREDICTED: ciliogenesis-associated TTC17-interacting protein-like [Camelina sativa]|uniref:Ciliogenesis-associated TTC17-interacting protein-like n=1 Tax=Camelina sativa TaxID=90675 RepID=A0ABM0Z3H0_CAMSA|nr:PREDICTED: ciliogenesis-associated TTC17-interacting protein-like [Camelina sativa]